jgi:hypothetical protein
MRVLIATVPAADARTANRTGILLARSVVASPLFTVGLARAFTCPGFDLRWHAMSILENGDLECFRLAGSRSPASVRPGGGLDAVPSEASPSRTSGARAPPYACTWNSCRAMRRTSIPTRASGTLAGVEQGNCCRRDLADLALMLRRAKERLRHKRTVIQSCFQRAGCHVSSFMQGPVVIKFVDRNKG